jgi:hypothetical protein
MKERFLLAFVSLDFWCTGPRLSFAIDHASHVSFLSFRLTAISLKYMLMEPSSFAIWNMNKVVMVCSTAVWVAYVTVMVVCEFHPSIP